MKTKYLVADTAAFIQGVPLWEYGEEVFSLPEVIGEIRDRQTRQRVEALPIPITMRQPQPHSIRFVNEFSKKTGDYASLSLADMKVLALTYELEVEARGGSDHLRKEPQKVMTGGNVRQSSKQANTPEAEATTISEQGETDVCCSGEIEEQSSDGTEGKEEPESDATDEGVECVKEDEEEEENEAQQENQEEGNKDNVEKISEESGEGSEEEEDDDDGWITPANIKKHKMKVGLLEDEKEEEDVQVACMTVDFAMQNMLKHIGLSVMGIDGKLIRHIRTFILRCYACFHTTSVMTKIFCPHCGNKTLKKVSVTVNPDGSQQIWINFKKPISLRGTKFSLPAPKGGKHARNPLLVADQREALQLSTKMSNKKVNPLHPDYDPNSMPFAVRDVYSRAAQLGYIGGKHHHHYYWEKRNPNEPQRKTGKKKRSKK
ncbi:hypothetical protein Pcinc_021931 [Petrolisthes cinctipes]|uniref:RNA-binding protein NOB1 n=1 Tax=Petrolisthes cinctipes TaxID=88211 RepID=A0AAE1FGI3_PETCI|nr:hypothetical protein Pcinc_021931 [Petrolisthes cinctipes]